MRFASTPRSLAMRASPAPGRKSTRRRRASRDPSASTPSIWPPPTSRPSARAATSITASRRCPRRAVDRAPDTRAGRHSKTRASRATTSCATIPPPPGRAARAVSRPTSTTVTCRRFASPARRRRGRRRERTSFSTSCSSGASSRTASASTQMTWSHSGLYPHGRARPSTHTAPTNAARTTRGSAWHARPPAMRSGMRRSARFSSTASCTTTCA